MEGVEFQMLYGVRPEEQHRLAAQGETVRVYLPYGDEWYGYLVRRLAERPANVALCCARWPRRPPDRHRPGARRRLVAPAHPRTP